MIIMVLIEKAFIKKDTKTKYDTNGFDKYGNNVYDNIKN